MRMNLRDEAGGRLQRSVFVFHQKRPLPADRPAPLLNQFQPFHPFELPLGDPMARRPPAHRSSGRSRPRPAPSSEEGSETPGRPPRLRRRARRPPNQQEELRRASRRTLPRAQLLASAHATLRCSQSTPRTGRSLPQNRAPARDTSRADERRNRERKLAHPAFHRRASRAAPF